MSIDAHNLIKEINDIICDGSNDVYLRQTMLEELANALSNFIQRNDNKYFVYDARRHFETDVAVALRYPMVFTPEQMGAIISLYGNFVKWKTKDKLNVLLDYLPGGCDLIPTASLNWVENARLRMEKFPIASVVSLTPNKLHNLSAQISKVNLNEIARHIGAFGYERRSYDHDIKFYFDDRDTAVLATLTYS